jgi:hypothetical protein
VATSLATFEKTLVACNCFRVVQPDPHARVDPCELPGRRKRMVMA